MDTKINNPRDAAALLMEPLAGKTTERLAVITISASHSVIAIHPEVTKGTERMAPFSVKQIARLALLDDASAVIIAHNHPSGDSRPSKQDCLRTQEVGRGLKVLEIEFIDHIIIGDGEFYSCANEEVTKL